MAKKKVLCKVLKWTDDKAHHVAFKGDVVDFPKEVAERFEDVLGDPDADVTTNGALADLATDATDEEVKSWLRSAKIPEVSSFLSDNPGMASRILDMENALTENNPRAGVVKAAGVAASTKS